MSPFTEVVYSEKELAGLAVRILPYLRAGDVVALVGDLGAGKTAFVRALVQSQWPEEEVPSPTFTLVQTYDMPAFTIWHFDLYRLKEKETDILELGWDEARRVGVSFVEWPERLGSLLPKDRLEISIAFDKDSDNSRALTFTPFGTWEDRLKEGI
jgi:tRNA threonylcarbamoyladenosine biosynthesis protein TsaE